MRLRAVCLVSIVMVTLGAAVQAAPDQSPRPLPRPTSTQETLPRPTEVPVTFQAGIRPRPRPGTANEAATAPAPVPAPQPTPASSETLPRPVSVPVFTQADIRPRPRPFRTVKPAQPERVIEVSSAAAVGRSIRPEARPEKLRQKPKITQITAVRSQPVAPTRGKSGRICGEKDILGEALAPIPAKLAGCGVVNPVRVASVAGVDLTTPATIDCNTARALNTWVKKGVKPAVGRLGGGVRSLRVVASYSCRTRNNRPGAKISEHGRGKAVDIAAINLQNGVSLTVLKGWRDPVQSKLLKRMHGSACGPFGTVLGPNSDKYHKDHFHLDTASYRSGPYCR